jgi:hypothetical protein
MERMLPCTALYLQIRVTFSTPTPDYVNYRRCGITRMRRADMSDVVHLFWFGKEVPEALTSLKRVILVTAWRLFPEHALSNQGMR